MPTIEQARAWYPASDPVHNFEHVLRVLRLAETIAQTEGADIEIVRAAALLHDAVGAADAVSEDAEGRAKHHHASAELAGEILAGEGWSQERIEAVQHCIQAHRFRDEAAPQTLEAQVLFDADKLDAIGAIGVARSIAYAALADQPIYTEPSDSFLQSGQKEPDEPHSSYHEFLFKLSKLKDRMYTATGQKLAAQRHEFIERFYSQLGDEIAGKA